MTNEEIHTKLQSVEGCIEVIEKATVAIRSLASNQALIMNQAAEFRTASLQINSASLMLVQYAAVQFQLTRMAEAAEAAKAKVTKDGN